MGPVSQIHSIDVKNKSLFKFCKYLFTQRHAATKYRRQGYNFSYSGAKSQIFFEDNPSQNSFHFWNSRT